MCADQVRWALPQRSGGRPTPRQKAAPFVSTTREACSACSGHVTPPHACGTGQRWEPCRPLARTTPTTRRPAWLLGRGRETHAGRTGRSRQPRGCGPPGGNCARSVRTPTAIACGERSVRRVEIVHRKVPPPRRRQEPSIQEADELACPWLAAQSTSVGSGASPKHTRALAATQYFLDWGLASQILCCNTPDLNHADLNEHWTCRHSASRPSSPQYSQTSARPKTHVWSFSENSGDLQESRTHDNLGLSPPPAKRQNACGGEYATSELIESSDQRCIQSTTNASSRANKRQR